MINWYIDRRVPVQEVQQMVVEVNFGPLLYLTSSPACMVFVPVLTIVHLMSNSSFGRKIVLSRGVRGNGLQAYSGFDSCSTAASTATGGSGRQHNRSRCRDDGSRGRRSSFRLGWKRGVRRCGNKGLCSLSLSVLRGNGQRDRGPNLICNVNGIRCGLCRETGREQKDQCHCSEQEFFRRWMHTFLLYFLSYSSSLE